MISCNLIGGLGNKMFQVATTYSLAVDNNVDCSFILSDSSNAHGHIDTYRFNIFRNIEFGNSAPLVHYQEPFFHYSEIPYSEKMSLSGYFQSEKYFTHNKGKILDLFSIDETSMGYIMEKYGDILKDGVSSLHVRRGDYLELQNHHPICTLDYYKESVDVIGDTTYLVFSNDVEWCKNNISNLNGNFIYVDGNPDYIDMWLMSLCDNNITSNSSFSWWGSWLNMNINKKVIAPNKWFGRAIQHDTSDLYYNKMMKL